MPLPVKSKRGIESEGSGRGRLQRNPTHRKGRDEWSTLKHSGLPQNVIRKPGWTWRLGKAERKASGVLDVTVVPRCTKVEHLRQQFPDLYKK